MKRMKPLEVFEYLDEKYRFIVGWRSAHPEWHWYYSAERPEITNAGWKCDGLLIRLPIAIDFDGPWEESLFERPKPKVMYDRDASLHYYNRNCCDIEPLCYESPPEVAAWFHKIMEESK